MSKPGRPNLSLAGKREAPVQQKKSRGGSSSDRGAGRGRGGRGRGARPRQELIQTGGVFSEGLGGDISKKKGKEDVGQFFYAKRPTGSGGGGPSSSTAEEKKDEKIEKKNVAGKASFEGWEELWRSDDEGDEEELKSLHPRSIISDLRRGNVMPVVLPVDDQSQFLNIIHKSARLSLEEEDQEEQEDKKQVQHSTRRKHKRQTPEQLISMLESSTGDLLHLQLPSVVGAICNVIEAASVEVPMEVDDEGTDMPAGIPTAPPPPTGLPQSRRIGKLQVTKKGRLILQVGGHSIDITAKPTAGKQQGTVLLEVDPNADQVQAPSTFSFQSNKTIENSLYHLGNVKHNLVGSMTWGGLSEKSKEEEESKKANEVEMQAEETTGNDDQEKIEQLEREQAKWANLAARWATGLPTARHEI
ncbi:hypothetical protein GCK72_000623 [Caenorhabditis remanei]|uniref:Uncharacterized protein n=1 Tax=Caenorhabditis remanei TaxID=31234 RepID=A0A6A5HKV1_CAERE|nr:hypothetical protein GCK72_000623 [Caenorhabditis remanei]KAF1768810.1 hypothetical protein GCK72_000623 [Caenorhabditis remanei]